MPRGLRTKPKMPKLGMGKGITPKPSAMPRPKMVGPTPSMGIAGPKKPALMKGGFIKPKRTIRGFSGI